jgi:hypothetical protein
MVDPAAKRRKTQPQTEPLSPGTTPLAASADDDSTGLDWRDYFAVPTIARVDEDNKSGDLSHIRIKAYYGCGGNQVCVAGVGEGKDFGTFPGHWEVQQLLQTPGWIRVKCCPEKNEPVKRNVHYELIKPSSWKPKTVIFNRQGAHPVVAHSKINKFVRVGAFGETAFLTVLDTDSNYQEVVQNKECNTLDDVETPPTPPPHSPWSPR